MAEKMQAYALRSVPGRALVVYMYTDRSHAYTCM